MEDAKVYYTKDLTPENVVKLFDLLDVQLPRESSCKSSFWRRGKSKLSTSTIYETNYRTRKWYSS